MLVIDWLQTSEFIRANSESFILYCLCGCFIGIAIVFLMIIIVLYTENRKKKTDTNDNIQSDYQVPRNDINQNNILLHTRSYLPVYRYDGKTHNEVYRI